MKPDDIVIEQALTEFYMANNINYDHYADSEEEQYTTGKLYDYRIARPHLKQKMAAWLEGFRAEDRVYFIRLFQVFTYVTEREFEYRLGRICRLLYEELDKCGIQKENICYTYRSGWTEVYSPP